MCIRDRYISVEMNRTALISGFGKDFRNAFKHSKTLVSNDETNAFEPLLFQPDKEVFPTFAIFLHAFSSTKDFAIAVIVHTNGHKNSDILDLATPASF